MLIKAVDLTLSNFLLNYNTEVMLDCIPVLTLCPIMVQIILLPRSAIGQALFERFPVDSRHNCRPSY